MAINDCSTNVYNIRYTDNTKNTINVNRTTLIQDVVDLTLLGQARKEYGEVFDENILHLLENFASEEDPQNPGNPYIDSNYASLLSHPTQGQKWYNKTRNAIYIYNGTTWIQTGNVDDIAGNSGIIAHGEYLPLPISPITGYQFSYDECAWFVSIWNIPDQAEGFTCTTNSSGLVTAQYTLVSEGSPTNSYAIYQIIGIRSGQINVLPTPTPTLTPSVTPSITPSFSGTPQPSVTRTPVASLTPTRSPTPTPSHSLTPYPSPSNTPQPSITPTPSSSKIPTLYLSGPGTNVTAACANLPTDSCTPSTSSTLSASGGVPPYTYSYSYISGTSSETNTYGSFGTSQNGSITIQWIGPNEVVGTNGHSFSSTFQYSVTDSVGQTTQLGNTTTVTYEYISTL